MSTLIKYGPLTTVLEKDAEGYAFSCPLCHKLFFTSGTLLTSQRLLKNHLEEHHRVCPSHAEVIENGTCQTKPQRLATSVR